MAGMNNFYVRCRFFHLGANVQKYVKRTHDQLLQSIFEQTFFKIQLTSHFTELVISITICVRFNRTIEVHN